MNSEFLFVGFCKGNAPIPCFSALAGPIDQTAHILVG